MRLRIAGRIESAPKQYSKGKWAEGGTPRFMVNLSRHVAAKSDPCTFVDVDGSADIEICVDLDAPVSPDASIRFDFLPLTSNQEGAPCRCKSGSVSMNLHALQGRVGKSISMKLSEFSDPHLDRGSIRFHVHAAEFPTEFEASGASISHALGRSMSLKGLQVYWDIPPGSGMEDLKRIHTPNFETFPGGTYGATLPHVASDETVMTNLAEVALERASVDFDVSAERVISATRAQAAEAHGSTKLHDGMYEAAIVFSEMCKTVATAYLYMTDHRSSKTIWPFAPAMDQMGEQFGQSRSTEADDCEGLGHEIFMLAMELEHGPGRMDAPSADWDSPLLNALKFVASHYVTAMTTWGVSAAALSGRAEDASHMTCHISAIAFPTAVFKRAMDNAARLKRTKNHKFLKPVSAWTSKLPVLMCEGTGMLCADLGYRRPNYAASVTERSILLAKVPELKTGVIKLYADYENPDLSSFYKALVSAFIPPGTIEGVLDVWFGPTDTTTYGVRVKDVVAGNLLVAPCLTMDHGAYTMCMEYAKAASVPPSLKPTTRVLTKAMRDVLAQFHDGAPSGRSEVHVEMYVRAEWFRSLLPAFKKAREHVVGMRAVAEPLVNGITTVRIGMWFK